jgi:hypothetical protein
LYSFNVMICIVILIYYPVNYSVLSAKMVWIRTKKLITANLKLF